MTSDLWLEASRDIEAEQAELSMSKAKMVTASIWPFLALSCSVNEFEHRLALAAEEIETAVPHPGERDQVIASFREDFQLTEELRAEAALDEEEGTALQFFHEASGTWMSVEAAAEETPGNPQYPDPVTEDGPATGETGDFPRHPTGADPIDPLQGMFPMQPSEWHDSVEWVNRPMSFAPYLNAGNEPTKTATRVQAADGYVDEGTETGPGPNPYYFAGGDEGVAGDAQQGFPVDVSAPESRSNERIDFYGNPPVESHGTEGGDHSYSHSSSVNKESAKDNHGACAVGDCGQPVYRQGDEWHHLNGSTDHHVMLDRDHPWVQQRLSARTAAYHYIHHDGDKWVITQKGTGKILSQHDSEDKAQEAFRAMEWSKHSSREGFFDPRNPQVAMIRTADVSSTDMGAGQSDDTAPDAPPSMSQGGPGAEAMPPMTIPNGSVSQNPFATGGNSTGAGGMPSSGNNPFMASYYTAEMTRDRPDMFNPTGVGDEYTDRTWEGQVNQSPRQNPDERNVNTPQKPQQPIPQNTSSGGIDEPDEEEEEGR